LAVWPVFGIRPVAWVPLSVELQMRISQERASEAVRLQLVKAPSRVRQGPARPPLACHRWMAPLKAGQNRAERS
jgi:hypothetical protein